MKNNDYLQKFLFEHASVRGELVRIEDGFQEILELHPYPHSVQELLGESLVIANLLGAIIKFQGKLSVQFQGQGPLKLLLAQCTNEHHFRGLIQYTGYPDKVELLDELENGTLAIMIDPQSASKQRYQGIVSWRGNSLAQAIEGYFRDSEQLPTRLWIAVNQHAAVGLLLQVLPGESSELREEDWNRIIHLTETLHSDELLQFDAVELIHRLYHQEDVRIFDPIDIHFQCTCSQEKSENAILMLGLEEAEEELRDKQIIVVTCEFCNRQYTFNHADVSHIFDKNRNNG